MIILAALAALAADPPRPGDLRTFQDWIVGCDNVRACHAVALMPEDGSDGLTMSVRREPGADSVAIVSFEGEAARGATLLADGRPLPVRLLATGENVIVHPGDLPALLAAFRSARVLQLAGAEGPLPGNVSLAGATAALLYMDEQQGRTGQPTGALAVPTVRILPQPEESPPEFPAARIAALRTQVGCAIGDVGGPDEFSAVQLEPGKTLILLACGTGAYNLNSVALIATAGSGEIVAAPFDGDSDRDEAGRVFLTNAEWDYGRRLLTAFALGRGLGDCGVRTEYGWDGTRFRLVLQREMGECRWARDYITTWRARVVGR